MFSKNGLQIGLLGFLILTLTALSAHAAKRDLSSLSFPQHSSSTNVGDILDDYPDYLRFVLEIGDGVDPVTSKKLSSTYESLRKRHPQGAARFLKGLRFEMVHKLELMGIPPAKMTSNNPEMRRWVRRFLKAWHREADEYLFRSLARH